MTSSEEDASELGSGKWATILRWSIAVGVVLCLCVLGGGILVRGIVDAEFLERHLNTPLAEATDGRYRVDIETVDWGRLVWSVRLTGLALRPDSTARAEGAGASTFSDRSGTRFRASAREVRLDGLHWWPLIWRRTLTLDAVKVHRPQVRIRETPSLGKSDRDSLSLGLGSSSAVGALQAINVHQVGVQGGLLTVGGKETPPRDSLWGVSLRFDSLSTQVAYPQSLRRFLVAHFVRGGFEGYWRAIPDRPYTLRLGAGQGAKGDSTLSVEALRFAPSVSDTTFMRQHAYRVNRVRAGARRVEVEGIDYRRFVADGAVLASVARVDSLQVEVYRDNHLPERPHDPPPPMPHEVVQDLHQALRIDTVRVRNGDIRYAKRPEEVPETGTISFQDLWASLYNVTNDPDRMTASTPAVVEVWTEVNGAGRLRATLRLPLLASDLTFGMHGRLGPMDATAFNETFVNLGGVRIERGQVDSLWFEASVEQGVASGSLQSVYRTLEIETLDKATGRRGLRNRLKTVLVNGLALRSKNVPGEGALHTGRIRHEHSPDKSFFKFLWLTLRSGIYSLVGVDRLP